MLPRVGMALFDTGGRTVAGIGQPGRCFSWGVARGGAQRRTSDVLVDEDRVAVRVTVTMKNPGPEPASSTSGSSSQGRRP